MCQTPAEPWDMEKHAKPCYKYAELSGDSGFILGGIISTTSPCPMPNLVTGSSRHLSHVCQKCLNIFAVEVN